MLWKWIFPQISSTSRGEVPSQTQRASEITHLLRFHVNVYFGRCVRLMFPPLNILEKRLKRTVCFFPHPPFEKTESIDGSKTNRSHTIAYLLSPADFFYFFHVLGEAALRVWETHVFYPLATSWVYSWQRVGSLDHHTPVQPHPAAPPQAAYRRKYIHSFLLPKIPKSYTSIFVCLSARDRQVMKTSRWCFARCRFHSTKINWTEMKNVGSSMLMTLIKSRGESQRSLAELRCKQTSSSTWWGDVLKSTIGVQIKTNTHSEGLLSYNTYNTHKKRATRLLVWQGSEPTTDNQGFVVFF